MAVFSFIAFWIIVAVVLFFIAVRGGPMGATAPVQSQSRRGRKVAAVAFAAIYVGCGVAVPLLLLTGNHANANNQVAGVKLDEGQKHGRQLFGEACGVCHSLAAANATGKVGPNLDELRPPKSLVLDALLNGRQRGKGTMPAGLFQRQTDATDVASFVAAVAGK